MKPKLLAWFRENLMPICIVLALLVICSVFYLKQSHFWETNASHAVEAVQILGGTTLSEEDAENLLDREEKLASLQEEYPDVIGWIEIPGTVIDYPLLYTETYDYYVDHNYTGEEDFYGDPFLDYRNATDFSDTVSILYGHNMSNGTMFAGLDDFREEETFDSITRGYLILSDGVHPLEFIASFAGNMTIADALTSTITDGTASDAFLETVLPEAIVQRDINLEENDKLIALTTLTYDEAENTDHTPTLLLARLSPAAEITEGSKSGE